MTHNTAIRLARNTLGLPTEDAFDLAEEPLAPLGDGEVRIRVLRLSIDPYLAMVVDGSGRFPGPGGRQAPLAVGAVIPGRGIGRVVESRYDGLVPGDFVQGEVGWQSFATVVPDAPGRGLVRFEPGGLPLDAWLAVLGPTGYAAYLALVDLGAPRTGETVLVSAAAGAIGSLAGQIARLLGCRAVGIAGGAEKCRAVVETFGFDAAVDYKAGADLTAAIAAACPQGVDVFFDNVGGRVHEAAIPVMNPGGRMVQVGVIASQAGDEAGKPHLFEIAAKELQLRGFMIGRHAADFGRAAAALRSWLEAGELTWRATVSDGLISAPAALAGLFEGRNIGKQIVRVAEP